MCQTELISKSIIRLSKRSFANRLDILSPEVMERKRMFVKLNSQLNRLYEQLYDSYQEITEKDYEVFAPYLSVLIETLKELETTCKQSRYKVQLADCLVNLRMNIVAIEEIDYDIRHFKINIKKNPQYSRVMNRIKSLRA